MFRKKAEPAPIVPHAVIALTSDYLIEGYTSLEECEPFLTSFEDDEEKEDSLLVITSAQIQPLGARSFAPASAASWRVPYSAGFIAAIPRDEAALAYVREQNEDMTHAFGAQIFAGPYAMRGTVLSCYEKGDESDLIFSFGSLLLQDVEIDYLGADGMTKGIKVNYAVVNMQAVQGILLND